MNIPLVSAVMPAYNAEKTIEAAVRSVLSQTFSDLELVVCNDASVDRTVEILASIDDSRLKIVHNPKNMGEGATRDHAIQSSVAPWIAVIDADDIWAANRLERLMACARDESCMVFDDLLICHDVNAGLVPWRAMRGEGAFGSREGSAVEVSLEDYIQSERLLIKPLMPAAFIKNGGLKHSNRKFGADTEYFIHLMGLGVKARYLPEPLYWYRVAPGSMTALARDPAMMRLCIEGCRQQGQWSGTVLQAFQNKIDALRCNEAMYQMVASLRKGDLFDFFGQVWANPGVLMILPRRVIKHLYYQLHRALHGGAGR